MVMLGGGTAGLLDESDAHRPDDELLTGEAVGLDLRPAPFALRAAGAAIDFLISLAGYLLLVFGGFWLAEVTGAEGAVFSIIAVASLVLCVVVYPVTIETATRGRSVGKFAIGARIVRDDGGAIGFRHALLRALTGVLEVYMTFGGLAAIVGLMSTRGKRLGDVLAGTYSQYERVARSPQPVFGVPVELTGWAQTADVARMPDALARRVAQFLSQAPKLTPERRRAIAASLASEAAAFVSPVPHVDPELFLAGAAVVRREREARALQLESERLARLEPALRGMPHRFPRRD